MNYTPSTLPTHAYNAEVDVRRWAVEQVLREPVQGSLNYETVVGQARVIEEYVLGTDR